MIEGLPVLRYPWVDGETLYRARSRPIGARPCTPAAMLPTTRFRRLPVDQIVYACTAVYSAHVEIIHEGFVAVDLFDGSLHYDFDRVVACGLIDLDEYRPGPVRVPDVPCCGVDAVPFAGGVQAPGAVVDERSTVYVLGGSRRSCSTRAMTMVVGGRRTAGCGRRTRDRA